MSKEMVRLDNDTRLCVIQALEERYCEVIESGRFSLEEEPMEDGFQVKCTLAGHDGDDELILEARVLDADHPKLKEEDRVHLGLDVIGYLFDQHLIDDPGVLPSLDWQEFDYAGVISYIRGDLRRPSLEASADLLLKGTGES
jgi:hypothetical protein